jgi:hypothetical protein
MKASTARVYPIMKNSRESNGIPQTDCGSSRTATPITSEMHRFPSKLPSRKKGILRSKSKRASKKAEQPGDATISAKSPPPMMLEKKTLEAMHELELSADNKDKQPDAASTAEELEVSTALSSVFTERAAGELADDDDEPPAHYKWTSSQEVRAINDLIVRRTTREQPSTASDAIDVDIVVPTVDALALSDDTSQWIKPGSRLTGAAARGTAAASAKAAEKEATAKAKEAGGRFLTQNEVIAQKERIRNLEDQNKRLRTQVQDMQRDIMHMSAAQGMLADSIKSKWSVPDSASLSQGGGQGLLDRPATTRRGGLLRLSGHRGAPDGTMEKSSASSGSALRSSFSRISKGLKGSFTSVSATPVTLVRTD